MRAARPLLAVLALAAAVVLAVAASAPAATITVTSQDDGNDGTCDFAHCSLREAILAANATAAADEILFNDDEPITPLTPLPPITETAHITSRADGRCRTDSAPLRLDGDSADFPGLVFAPGSDGSRLCLVNVRGFSNGIEFRSDDNAIRLSRIGTSPDGTFPEPNSGAGILVIGDDNLIGGTRDSDRNVISGNGFDGIFVGEAAGTRIAGNLIGTDPSGTTAIPNGIGVDVAESASDTTVGGTEPGTGNVISGNDAVGVSASDGRVVGNLIGLDSTGTAALPNERAGVEALAPIQIGGRSEAERNVISGNALAELELRAAATVEGNWIGLAADGSELPSAAAAFVGVLLRSGDGATIGGTSSGAANVIAGNGAAVESLGPASDFVVQGNLIGLAPDGTTPVATGTGIRIGEDTTGARVGGVEDGAGNTVTSADTGIAVAGDGTRVEGNTVGLDANGNADGLRETGISVAETAEGTTIGSDGSGARNTISDLLFGIELEEGSAGTVVERNFIGTDRDGMEERPNEIGVLVRERADVRIGGARPAQRNVISGNTEAGLSARVVTGHAVVEGNYFGVGADGTTALGNGEGIVLGGPGPVAPAPASDDGFVVGGTAAGAGNRIAHNRGDGVRVFHTTGGVTILGNETFANDGGDASDLGIDFADNAVSPNGSESPDVLPPFPVLTNVDAVTAGTLVQGTIDYPAGRDVRIELFSGPTCDGSGHGEGQTPLGALTLTGSGAPAAFSARVDAAPAGHAITATATDLDLHRTSEFSRCAFQTAGSPPPPPSDDPPPGPGSSDPPAPGPVGDVPGPPLAIDVPPRPRCKVPNVVGLKLAKAKRRLTLAGCGVGKVAKPKRRRPGKRFRLVVKRTSHRSGATRPPGAAIGLTLKWKRIRTRRQ
jgi:CSLREA domain-containing protein